MPILKVPDMSIQKIYSETEPARFITDPRMQRIIAMMKKSAAQARLPMLTSNMIGCKEKTAIMLKDLIPDVWYYPETEEVKEDYYDVYNNPVVLAESKLKEFAFEYSPAFD